MGGSSVAQQAGAGTTERAYAPNSSGPMSRPFLVSALATPVAITLASLLGSWLGLYPIGAALAVVVTANIGVLIVVVWVAARALFEAGNRRRQADEASRQAVADLAAANRQLQTEAAERLRAEAAARASEERFLAMFFSSPAAMVLSRLPDLTYAMVNESWLRMTGFNREEVIGKTAAEVGLLTPEERTALYARVQEAGELHEVDMTFRARDGSIRHALVSGRRLAAGGETYQFMTLVDVTARVQARDDLRETNRRLEQALSELRVAQRQIAEQERVGALGQLASGIAHDFNNTLGPILGYSDLLLANPALLAEHETVTDYLRIINTAAQGAADVISRLRDFYRRRQNGDAEGPAHLPDLIAQAISLTRPRWKDQAQANGAMIEVVAEVEDVPPIEGSPSELRDALVNLILNATDAMPAGGTITLRARRVTSDSGAEESLVEVADTGAGMSQEVRRRCLEPFFTTKGDQGTGLGLSIVHGTLRRHGGTLEIDTVVGQGTTMRLRLPVRRAVPPEPALPTPARPPARRSLRILVVDDEPMMRQVVTRFLEIDEHGVELAGNGREALARLQSLAPFDLVITDRAMPEMGGDELAAMVKVLTPGTPVLMLTGFADLMAAADQRPEGVDLVIGKPTTLARLRVAIATLVGDPDSAPDPAPSVDVNAQ